MVDWWRIFDEPDEYLPASKDEKMTNEERFKLLEDTIRRLENELGLQVRAYALDRERREERYRALQDHCLALEAKNQELNRRLFKDTQMNEAPKEEEPQNWGIISNGQTIIATTAPPQQGQSLQQLMQAAGVNVAKNQPPAKIPCPQCGAMMNHAAQNGTTATYVCVGSSTSLPCGNIVYRA